MIQMRYLGLVFFTGAAGFLTCFFFPFPNGMMAAVMGMAISCGTIWLSETERRTGHSPTLRQVQAVGLASGILAALWMFGAQALFPYAEKGGEMDFLRPPAIPAWAVITMGICYGLVLHLAYYRRRTAEHPLRRVFIYGCLGSFLIKFVVGIPAYWDPEMSFAKLPTLVEAMAIYSCLGAVPFAFLWMVVTASLDPAWSVSRRTEFLGVSNAKATAPSESILG